MTRHSIQTLTPDSFAPYGRVFARPRSEPLAATDAFSFWNDITHYAVEGETEIGWCDVREAGPVDWFERHDNTPEIVVPVDGPVALPVMGESESVEVFRVDVGQAVVVAPSVWHSACIPIGREEAGYFVFFRRGTPADDVTKTTVDPFVVALDTTRARAQ